MKDTSRKLPKKDLKKVTKSGSLEAKHKNRVQQHDPSLCSAVANVSLSYETAAHL